MRALPFLLLASCADVAEPFELDHARIMAVAVTPPGLVAGETARIEVLITDDGGARVADPAEVEVSSPFGLDLARRSDGWYVTADAREGVAALDVAVGPLVAQKTLAFGARAANPPAPMIASTLDPIPAGRDLVLAPSVIDEAWSYRWFSSVGELTGYTRAEATLEPLAGARGTIALVVRDQAGGTSWVISDAVVMP